MDRKKKSGGGRVTKRKRRSQSMAHKPNFRMKKSKVKPRQVVSRNRSTSTISKDEVRKRNIRARSESNRNQLEKERVMKSLRRRLDQFSLNELMTWNDIYDKNMITMAKQEVRKGKKKPKTKNSSLMRVLSGKIKREAYKMAEGEVYQRLSDKRYFVGTAKNKEKGKEKLEVVDMPTEDELDEITTHYVEKYLSSKDKEVVFEDDDEY